jgi:translation initiation factor IF-1
MAKEDMITLQGTIIECLPAATFKVELETKQVILGYINGRMRQNQIRVLMGDQVDVEMSPYDLSRCRITRRR